MKRLNLIVIPVFLMIPVSLAVLVTLAGCNDAPDSLAVTDLTPDELSFVERYVLLERARMVTLTEPDVGEAILDSLAAAWGDSAEVEALRQLPTEPRRARLVHDLLYRLLEAETDSLTHAPRVDRLSAPLPEPIPPE